MALPTQARENIEKQKRNNLRYAIREYFADNPLSPVPPSKKDGKNLQLPNFSDLSPKQVIKKRNEILTKKCRQRKLELSNVVQLPEPDSYIKREANKGQNPYELKKVKSLAKDRDDSKASTRKNLVFEDTNRKLQKVRIRNSSGDEGEFCYWQFQNSLKLRTISKESCCLRNKIGGDDVYVLQSPSLRFEDIYGPIDRTRDDMRSLLKNFPRNFINNQEIKWKLYMLLAFCHKFGKFAALKAIQEMEAFTLERLKLPSHLPEYRLMEVVKNQNSILNADPLRNSSHTDWFHLKRFENPVGPLNLFIRHEKLEKLGLAEYQLNPKTVVITGLCTPFIDTIFTFPVKKTKDPCRKLYQGKDKADKENRARNWNVIYETIRRDVNLYTCGVEISLFFQRLKSIQLLTEQGFENISEAELVASLPEFFIVTELPRTRAKILFPTFMKFILPMVDGQLGVLMIIEKFWRRIVFLVRVKGGWMRNMDFKWEYWNFFKKGIVIQEWGFREMGEFVKWCNQEWNPDGRDECVEVVYHSGSGDPFLVYKPGNKGEGSR